MPVTRRARPRRALRAKRVAARYRRAFGRRPPRRVPRPPRAITTNTASVKECYQLQIPDGQMVFGRNFALNNVQFDRAQTVAQAYQEFRIKYIKLTFRPSADTFQPIAGNVIPQLYYMIDKTNSIPTTADANTMFSLGCRPKRFDDKNIVVAWKPATIQASYTAPGVATAQQMIVSPWLSTNANAYNPAGAWAPSGVDHLGIVFYVVKINPADALNYFVDVEVVFQFRKPNWKGESAVEGLEIPAPAQLQSFVKISA